MPANASSSSARNSHSQLEVDDHYLVALAKQGKRDAYDQIILIADVVGRGGKDAQSIRDGLAATKNFFGVTGSVEFDKNNQNVKMDTIHYMETLPDLSWKALHWN